MAFKSMASVHESADTLSNSEVGVRFLERYNQFLIKKCIDESEGYTPHRTFAPSSIRCKRRNWFRIRGTVPDKIGSPDLQLEHIKNLGTFMHEGIQEDLIKMLGCDWISIEDYLIENPIDVPYELKKEPGSFETKISITEPPVQFACDGIIRIDGKYYLLEIKTCELNTLRSLTEAKQEHIDQVKCYGTLLNIDRALVLYKDRLYGNMKAFTYDITLSDKNYIQRTFIDVLDAVNRNIPPEGLPVGDKWCNPNYCVYYKSCKQWGR